MKVAMILAMFVAGCASSEVTPDNAKAEAKAAETKVATAVDKKCEFKPATAVSEADYNTVIAEYDVAGLETEMQSTGGVAIYDANSDETRAKMGMIPGAKPLTNYKAYEMAELDADKNKHLVFYCGNTQCSASDKAACTAQKAGYKRVSVLRPGIKGWVDAGKETVKQ